MGKWVRGSLGLSSPREAVGGSESFSPVFPFKPNHTFCTVMQGFWSLAAD